MESFVSDHTDFGVSWRGVDHLTPMDETREIRIDARGAAMSAMNLTSGERAGWPKMLGSAVESSGFRTGMRGTLSANMSDIDALARGVVERAPLDETGENRIAVSGGALSDLNLTSGCVRPCNNERDMKEMLDPARQAIYPPSFVKLGGLRNRSPCGNRGIC